MSKPETQPRIETTADTEAGRMESAAAPSPAAPRPGMAIEARLAFLAVLVFVAVTFLIPEPPADLAPMGELEDAAGEKVDMENQMAPVTLVHFWSTWCPPCITETPAIERLAADLASETGFRLLMVAVQDEKDKVADFLGSADETFYDDDWEVAHSYGTKKLPETHLVVDGRLVESFIGAISWDDPNLRQRITDAIDSTRESS